MKTAKQLADEGFATLACHGWPEKEAQRLAAVFMEAGAALVVETMQANQERNEALIKKAQVN